MKKLSWIISVLVITTIVAGLVFALPNKAKGSPVAPPKFVAFQPKESQLTKVVFIRYAPRFAKDKPCNNDGICDADEKWQFCSDCSKANGEEPPEEPTTACYGFLSGAKPKWNWIENYVYNDEDLEVPSFNAVTTWEGATSGDIFGTGSYALGYDWGVYDYENSISFDDYPEQGVLAVAALWYRGKNIYEYDIMFDTDYAWGDATNQDVIDLKTVTLHEFGHAAGLDDLYDSVCVNEVMYWQYKGVKTTLADGDKAGIQTLYGK